MIFVTVGTQLAFPRLIAAMNEFASTSGEEVIAQVGNDRCEWPNLTVVETLEPAAFAETFARARIIVAHAGVGTILSARQYGRPLVVVPRRLALGEHRNDHQVHMARSLNGVAGVRVAWEVEELPALLKDKTPMAAAGEKGRQLEGLLGSVAQFIDAGRRDAATGQKAERKG